MRRYGPVPRPLEQRFWPKVQKSIGGCWLWIAGGDSETGYGRIRVGGRGTKHEVAHRVSWELTNGPIPEGLWVLHHCDTPRCVRPDHLYLGTVQDNNADRVARGRSATGEAWYRAHKKQWRVRYEGRPVTVANGRPRRTVKDPVTAVVRWSVMRRDGGCVLALLDPEHRCRDKWGNPHAPTATRSLTVEHVKDSLRMGKRAPSDLDHLVAMCHAGNVGVPSKRNRAKVRDYLATVNDVHSRHVDPCAGCPPRGVAA